MWEELEKRAQKGRKVRKHFRLAKAAGAEPSGGMRDQKLHAAVARSTFRCRFGALLEVELFKKCTRKLTKNGGCELQVGVFFTRPGLVMW